MPRSPASAKRTSAGYGVGEKGVAPYPEQPVEDGPCSTRRRRYDAVAARSPPTPTGEPRRLRMRAVRETELLRFQTGKFQRPSQDAAAERDGRKGGTRG